MSGSNQPYRIVVAVDFAEMTDAVLAVAAEQASLHPSAEVHALCVIEPVPRLLGKDEEYSEELGQIEPALRARVAGAFTDGGVDVQVHARVGPAADEILELARERQADLIVLGRHSQTRKRPMFLGSVPARILHLSRCSVMVVQPTDYQA